MSLSYLKEGIADAWREPCFMLRGKFAQGAEWLSIVLILCGIVALCQPKVMWLFSNGFTLLLIGWIGLTVFSHRKPVP